MGRFPQKRCGHGLDSNVVTCKGDSRDRYGRLIGVCFFADATSISMAGSCAKGTPWRTAHIPRHMLTPRTKPRPKG